VTALPWTSAAARSAEAVFVGALMTMRIDGASAAMPSVIGSMLARTPRSGSPPT
jgi:hypothetical protein